MKKRLLLIVFLFFGHLGYAQNYFEYQAIFNRVDEDVLAKNYGLALQRMDTVLNGYSFIFSRHCIKALQLCSCAGDTVRASIWLDKCAVQGVPYWVMQTNALTAKMLPAVGATLLTSVRDSSMDIVTKMAIDNALVAMHYDSIYVVSRQPLNKELAAKVEKMIERDQRFTRRVNDGFILLRYTLYYPRWLHNNKKQFRAINKMIDQYGYPGERLIGLPPYLEDSATAAGGIVFYGPNLFDSRVWTMLVHYYSNPRKAINNKLLVNVQKGYMSAKQYADLNDMMADRGKTRFGKYVYYNTWHTDPDAQNLDSINARRLAIGINDYTTQQRNRITEREKRKNKEMNATVIME